MVTNRERREVAERLRELPGDVYEVAKEWYREGIDTNFTDQTDYYQIHLAVMGCLPADNMHPCDYEEFHNHLADLIDRTTCRNVAVKREDEFLCSACGEHVDIAYMDSVDGYHARYCPNCGAEVIDD